MKGEMYYRETYPKELRIQIENEDELKFLKILFSYNPKHTLKKFTVPETSDTVNESWRKRFMKKVEEHHMSDNDTQYQNYEIFDALATEIENEDALKSSDEN
jgi:hypothetical protein